MPELPHQPRLIATDTREIEITIPPATGDTHTLGEYIVKAASDGLTLVGAALIQTGQRDPVTRGLRLTFKRAGT